MFKQGLKIERPSLNLRRKEDGYFVPTGRRHDLFCRTCTHGCCLLQQAKVENLQRLYEIDDHPERRAWLDKLLSFMEERGTPISQCPTISKNPLDLYRLYIFTKDRGGFLEVGAGRGGLGASRPWFNIRD